MFLEKQTLRQVYSRAERLFKRAKGNGRRDLKQTRKFSQQSVCYQASTTVVKWSLTPWWNSWKQSKTHTLELSRTKVRELEINIATLESTGWCYWSEKMGINSTALPDSQEHVSWVTFHNWRNKALRHKDTDSGSWKFSGAYGKVQGVWMGISCIYEIHKTLQYFC